MKSQTQILRIFGKRTAQDFTSACSFNWIVTFKVLFLWRKLRVQFKKLNEIN